VTTLTLSQVVDLPRVNLLPPEIAQAAKFRQLKILLGLIVAGALLLVVAAFVWAGAQVSSAQAGLEEAQATGTALQAEAAQYAEVPRVNAEVAAAETNLSTAMAPEIRYSFYLSDLSLTIPESVRLTTLTAVNSAAALQLDAGGQLPVSVSGAPGVGTNTFDGKAKSFDAVAAWLVSLSKQPGYVDPYVGAITKEDGGTTVGDVYTYSSTVTVTGEALSQRYAPQAGG